MAAPTTIQGDLHVVGAVTGASITPSSGTVTNDKVAAAAGIAATKLEHQYMLTYGQNGTAASVTIPIHSGYGATGDIIAIQAGSVTAATGAATVTVDLRKDGTTCLSSVITLDNANAAYTPEAGTLSVSSYVATDVFTLVIVATAGGGTLPTGLYVTVVLREDAAP